MDKPCRTVFFPCLLSNGKAVNIEIKFMMEKTTKEM